MIKKPAGQKSTQKFPDLHSKIVLKNVTFDNFPHSLDIPGCVENSETAPFLHRFACVSLGMKKLTKHRFTTFGVFTKYHCFNAFKWSQMIHK